MKKNSQITLKLTDDDFEFLKEIAEHTGFSAQAMARQMIAAVRRQWKATKRISLPLVLADNTTLDTSLASEETASAKGKKRS